MSDGSTENIEMTAGLDLGDQYSYLYVLKTEKAANSSKRGGCAPPPTASFAASTPNGS